MGIKTRYQPKGKKLKLMIASDPSYSRSHDCYMHKTLFETHVLAEQLFKLRERRRIRTIKARDGLCMHLLRERCLGTWKAMPYNHGMRGAPGHLWSQQGQRHYRHEPHDDISVNYGPHIRWRYTPWRRCAVSFPIQVCLSTTLQCSCDDGIT